MPSIPLPLLVALALAVLLVRVARPEDEAPPNRWLIALVAACTLQSVLIGLRWGYGIEALRVLLPVVAATIPPLTYAAFALLAAPRNHPRQAVAAALPAALVALLVAVWRGPLDLVLMLLYLGYALALLRLALSGTDALARARFDGVRTAHLALIAAAALLAASALVDALVLLDLRWTSGRHVSTLIGWANVLSPLVLGLAARIAGRARAARPEPPAAEGPAQPPAGDDEIAATMERVEALVAGQHLYRDPDLSLGRLSRRAGITARRVSAAVNRSHGTSVSQYINGHRIREACRLLATTDEPVTRVMFDAGFQTKSNFNREFLRLTGTSPRAWRATHRHGPGTGDDPAEQPAAPPRPNRG